MKSGKFGAICCIGVIALIVLVGCGKGIYAYTTTGSTVATIQGTEVKGSGSGKNFEQRYLVFTDQGVFEDTDSLWRLKWNSSDVYGYFMAHKGKKVKISYYGWRVGFLSWYPNIYAYESAE